MGNTSSVKWIGTIGEYRIDWGPGYRIYLGRDGDALIILLGGGTKKVSKATSSAPRRCGPNTGGARLPPEGRRTGGETWR
jgi:putative component of toxin-antitoxin plasmid stabilization module